MKILFINRVYPPSRGATGEMLASLAEALAAKGYEVTVLVSAEDALEQASLQNGVHVQRVGRKLSRRSFLTRALGYLTLIPALLIRALRLPRADFVVTLTDPPMLAVIGPIVGFLKRSRSIHWAQDIYPELAEELGVLSRRSPLVAVLRGVSTWALKRHGKIISIGRCMTSRLEARGIAAQKIALVPNWTTPGAIRPLKSEDNSFRRTHLLQGMFVVGYSGNLGLAHEFETILEAAKMLSGENVLFLFVGSGPRLADVEEAVGTRGLKNVSFLPSQSRESLSESLSAPDLHLVTMQSHLGGLVVPSKFYSVMAAGRPCLFVGPGESEVARVIEEHGVGKVVRIGAPADLANAVLHYRDHAAIWAEECARARAVGESANVGVAAEVFAALLEEAPRGSS